MIDSTQLWAAIRAEARQMSEEEPVLASFFHAGILHHADLGAALSYQLSTRLESEVISAVQLREVFCEAYRSEPALVAAAQADICAVYERDPACDHYLLPLLYFKGFHAIQTHRVAHWLWTQQRTALAFLLQNLNASVFDVDIHPGAVLGAGLMIDHATGVVIGETAVVGNGVSMLHGVTLGGCGTRAGEDRHPKIADGVLISAGAKVLGAVRVGQGAKVGAGSVVLDHIPDRCTAAGVPARLIGCPSPEPAAQSMDQHLGE